MIKTKTYSFAGIKDCLERHAEHEQGFFNDPIHPDTTALIDQLNQLRDWVEEAAEDCVIKTWHVETAVQPIEMRIWYMDDSGILVKPSAEGVVTEPLRS